MTLNVNRLSIHLSGYGQNKVSVSLDSKTQKRQVSVRVKDLRSLNTFLTDPNGFVNTIWNGFRPVKNEISYIRVHLDNGFWLGPTDDDALEKILKEYFQVHKTVQLGITGVTWGYPGLIHLDRLKEIQAVQEKRGAAANLAST